MSRVLITGCSSGFGLATALTLAGRGHQVFATCRRRESVDELTRLHAHVAGLFWRQLDVTDAAAAGSLVGDIVTAAGGIDILVNNAGIAHPGALEDVDAAALGRVMETNFFGAIWTTRAVLPVMRKQGSGMVIMVSSLSALVGLPGEGIYGASKAALEVAAEALRYEVERFGIRVIVLEPGAYATAMPGKIATAGAGPENSPYAPLIAYLTANAAARVGSQDDPEKLAGLIADLVETPPDDFRIAAGEQARQVTQTLEGLAEKDRGDFIRGVHDTTWWSRGKPSPSDTE